MNCELKLETIRKPASGTTYFERTTFAPRPKLLDILAGYLLTI